MRVSVCVCVGGGGGGRGVLTVAIHPKVLDHLQCPP